MTFNGRFLLNLIHFAGVQGASVPHLLSLTGFSAIQLCDQEQTVEAEIYNAVVEEAVSQTGDPYFGLHAGEHLNLSAAGLIAQITQTSSTVKEALDYCCEFAMLGCRSIPMKLLKQQDIYRLSFIPDALWAKQSPLAVKHTIEGMLSFTLREFHTLTRHRHFPLSVNFSDSKPNDIDELKRIFNCQLNFDQSETTMLFAERDVEQPIISSDYDLLRVLVSHARQKMEEIEQKEGFFPLVKRSVMNLIKPGFPTINQVASNLNISVRSLQRRLKEEGHTFKELINNLRKELALAYLNNNKLSINDIAFLLDYADASAFIRSFKKWKGQTPQSFRQEKSL